MGGKYINDMNIEDLIIKQINDSVSVKTKVLADEALRDKIIFGGCLQVVQESITCR